MRQRGSFNYYGGAYVICNIYVVIRTHDGPKNHVFPNVYTPYLVLTTMLTFPRNARDRSPPANKLPCRPPIVLRAPAPIALRALHVETRTLLTFPNTRVVKKIVWLAVAINRN